MYCDTGRYACQITPRPQPTQSQVSTADITVVVTATVMATQGQGEVRAEPLTVQYVPPFYVYNTEIHVSTLSPVSSVRLSTTTALASQVQVCEIQ